MNDDKKIILHSVTNEEQNSFVGLRIRNGEIHFHYPESYHIAKQEDRKAFRHDVVNIIRTISLAKSKANISFNNDNGVAQNDQFAIMSYLPDAETDTLISPTALSYLYRASLPSYPLPR